MIMKNLLHGPRLAVSMSVPCRVYENIRDSVPCKRRAVCRVPWLFTLIRKPLYKKYSLKYIFFWVCINEICIHVYTYSVYTPVHIYMYIHG